MYTNKNFYKRGFLVEEIEQIEKTKKTSESREVLRIENDTVKIKNSSSGWYYASLVLLNVIALIFCYLYFDYMSLDVQKISIVFDNFDYNCIVILVVCFFVILFLQTLPIFLRIYSKTKYKNFATVFGGVIAGEFYGRVTFGGNGKLSMMVDSISKFGAKKESVIDSTYGHNNIDKISFLLYSFLMIFLGLIFWSGRINVVLLIIGVLIFLYNLSKIIFVFMFNSNKKKTLNILSKIIRSAYNLHIIKDYEKVYNRLVDKLIISVKDFKTNKALIFVEIFANLLRYFLKCSAIYFILVSLNFAQGELFGELLFKCVILQLILDVWPVQNGTFIFEIVFATLFTNSFLQGYVWWGMILYRFFDYFLYVFAYCFYKVFDMIFENKRLKN